MWLRSRASRRERSRPENRRTSRGDTRAVFGRGRYESCLARTAEPCMPRRLPFLALRRRYPARPRSLTHLCVALFMIRAGRGTAPAEMAKRSPDGLLSSSLFLLLKLLRQFVVGARDRARA